MSPERERPADCVSPLNYDRFPSGPASFGEHARAARAAHVVQSLSRRDPLTALFKSPRPTSITNSGAVITRPGHRLVFSVNT
ncbi:hypothetical protein EVAR_96141_1 [Eumeta japonica]|uniref:Uncharacterized protein n=1 Tax=Eumeta variegata TaxID=151549 RepID=A0A4C2AAC4_EUMVA|nr:hypothetical protein EVAR_96141_1 [Eumeta japonica]